MAGGNMPATLFAAIAVHQQRMDARQQQRLMHQAPHAPTGRPCARSRQAAGRIACRPRRPRSARPRNAARNSRPPGDARRAAHTVMPASSRTGLGPYSMISTRSPSSVRPSARTEVSQSWSIMRIPQGAGSPGGPKTRTGVLRPEVHAMCTNPPNSRTWSECECVMKSSHICRRSSPALTANSVIPKPASDHNRPPAQSEQARGRHRPDWAHHRAALGPQQNQLVRLHYIAPRLRRASHRQAP